MNPVFDESFFQDLLWKSPWVTDREEYILSTLCGMLDDAPELGDSEEVYLLLRQCPSDLRRLPRPLGLRHQPKTHIQPAGARHAAPLPQRRPGFSEKQVLSMGPKRLVLTLAIRN